jgi:hypothetical protein
MRRRDSRMLSIKDFAAIKMSPSDRFTYKDYADYAGKNDK